MFRKLVTFLREVRIEMSRVSWPSRDELISSTGVVIAISILFAIFVAIVDFSLSNIVRVIFR